MDTYRRFGLFERWRVTHIPTHEDGDFRHKLGIAGRALARFLVLLGRGEVALVHVHSASNASFWRKAAFILPARAAGAPVIFHLHGGGFVDFYERSAGPARRWLIRRVLACAAEIVVLSDAWRRQIRALTANPNVTVIPNPVAVDTAPPGQARYAARTVLFVGRLTASKGLVELMTAVGRLARRFPAMTLELAGDGERELVERAARDAGATHRVKFLGWIDAEEKQRALARASVFALPSYVEGLPMALLEAMAAGLPIVSTRVGGIPNVVQHERNGILVAPRDVDQLEAALARLLADPKLCRAMGAAARKKASRDHAPCRVIGRIEALYRRHGLEPMDTGQARPAAHPAARPASPVTRHR